VLEAPASACASGSELGSLPPSPEELACM
jgi:hypothetical protein